MRRRRIRSRHGKHDGGSAAREEVGGETLNALVYLDGGGPGREGEVEAVHQSGLVHAGEPPEGGLRLAGACLGLDDDEALIEGGFANGRLNRIGRTVNVEQISEFGHAIEAVSLSG